MHKQAEAVQRAFTEGGLPAKAINLDVLPPSLAKYRYVGSRGHHQGLLVTSMIHPTSPKIVGHL